MLVGCVALLSTDGGCFADDARHQCPRAEPRLPRVWRDSVVRLAARCPFPCWGGRAAGGRRRRAAPCRTPALVTPRRREEVEEHGNIARARDMFTSAYTVGRLGGRAMVSTAGEGRGGEAGRGGRGCCTSTERSASCIDTTLHIASLCITMPRQGVWCVVCGVVWRQAVRACVFTIDCCAATNYSTTSPA